MSVLLLFLLSIYGFACVELAFLTADLHYLDRLFCRPPPRAAEASTAPTRSREEPSGARRRRLVRVRVQSLVSDELNQVVRIKRVTTPPPPPPPHLLVHRGVVVSVAEAQCKAVRGGSKRWRKSCCPRARVAAVSLAKSFMTSRK